MNITSSISFEDDNGITFEVDYHAYVEYARGYEGDPSHPWLTNNVREVVEESITVYAVRLVDNKEGHHLELPLTDEWRDVFAAIVAKSSEYQSLVEEGE